MKPNGSLSERDVPIQEGRMVFASSSSPDDRMGPLLLRRGRITLSLGIVVPED